MSTSASMGENPPTQPLPARPLGKTGLMVSALGLGTVALGRSLGLKYPRPVRVPSDEEAIALLTAAADLNIRLIDTAPAYGVSEERLGVLLPRIAPRDHWVLCTKAGESFDPTSETSSYDFSAAAIRSSVERSLRRLATDRLDIVLLHFAGSGPGAVDVEILQHGEAIGELQRLQQRGMVRCAGVSAGSAAGAALAAVVADVLMLAPGPDGTIEQPALDFARRRGVGVLIKKPLASGHASNPARTLRAITDSPGVAAAVVGTTNPLHLLANAQSVR